MKTIDPAKAGSTAGVEILKLLQMYPNGLNAGEIRASVGTVGDQEQLMRRLRHVRKYYHVPYEKVDDRWVYVFRGEKQNVTTDSGIITGKQRARILNLAKGRCQMCGRTVDEDSIKLQVDHRVPQTWGGLTVDENLWAICVQCNHGKRDFFASFNPREMAELVKIESVHERIARFLKMHKDEWVDSHYIEDIANVRERQDDWQKRLRELRYPVVGMDIETGRYKTPEGFIRSRYKLTKWVDLPPNHQKLIRDWDDKKKRLLIKQQLGLA
ncbi:HNH endonuclease [Sphingorhabdus lacus]|uniref:HNH endonuclease n=1 Tax=Sphingorhabdus lacus TaxID=392610 RepID=A0A6I6LAN3_9SPHN|nr:HNH endonuclease signature motif containing protein [Sphingorhabdus lacus]QGY79303.1 HNH endonuclease [Sphingorhabdus lacus]